MSFGSYLPSYGQFKLLRFGIGFVLFIPMVAFCLVLGMVPRIIDYCENIRATNRLMEEGALATYPLENNGYVPLSRFGDKWVCSLKVPGGTFEYYRRTDPNGLQAIHFLQHPDITGTLESPRVNWSSRPVVVDVPEKYEWSDVFAAYTESTFAEQTWKLLLWVVLTVLSVWLAVKSYFWMKGGRPRRRRRHRYA
ncbi:MAG TPA: hypothetical protein VG796_21090 [Verrucomicrobiales bacterium]|nr:hypothetical protein [Verrucomicrobiales bacterium]